VFLSDTSGDIINTGKFLSVSDPLANNPFLLPQQLPDKLGLA